jgi:phosphopantetheinyl transferase
LDKNKVDFHHPFYSFVKDMKEELHIIHHQLGDVDIYLLALSSIHNWQHIERSISSNERAIANNIRHQTKRNEYLAVRALKNKIFPSTELCYTAIGAPYLKNGPYISISHTEGLVGIASCSDFPIGFDLEGYKDKIKSIAQKFLSEQEISQIQPFEPKQLIPYWCAKEVLYKVSGKIGWQFNQDFHIKSSGRNELIGAIKTNAVPVKTLQTKIIFKDLGECCMAVSVTPLNMVE